ncbi:hypothetical protein OPV22_033862 [Ensete ventricosum]|uniref:Hexosyltransferase n=1 Tax=Ensete ventricosum TaxID=4639 RepID=A0AAV8PQU2_ENSVE|nr:hypothetical protein OPV22_033862 [Ensete ventricosum]
MELKAKQHPPTALSCVQLIASILHKQIIISSVFLGFSWLILRLDEDDVSPRRLPDETFCVANLNNHERASLFVSHFHRPPASVGIHNRMTPANQKLKVVGVDERKFLFPESSSSRKLALFVLACCMVLTLAFSPITRKDQPLHSSSRYSLLWSNGELSSVHLDHADTNLTWELLYPEWIDEEEESGVAPACPSLSQPRVERGSESLDLVADKLLCDRSRRWSRDVARLHLQLVAAKLAAASAALRVLLLTDCLPLPNLFTCRDLVRHEGNLWLYKPDPATLEEKLRLPVGSCELAIPYEAKVRMYTETGEREAYATILQSAEHCVCGAIAAVQSLRSSESARMKRSPDAIEAAWKLQGGSKFRLWQLTDYDKVVSINADLLVPRNIDFLFAMPEVSTVGNNATLFNSGVMVVEPSDCTFRLLMDHVDEITS